MRRNLQENVQISWWTATHSCLAFSSKPYTHFVIYATWYIYLQLFFFRHSPATATDITPSFYPLTIALAGRTSPFYGKEPLLSPDFAGTSTSTTGDGRGSLFGPITTTFIASRSAVGAYRRTLAVVRLLKGYLKVVSQIGSRLRT
jgi:hypothetical protein